MKQREVVHIKTSIEMLHHMLATASYGVLRGMGAPHVKDCQCVNCKRYRRYRGGAL